MSTALTRQRRQAASFGFETLEDRTVLAVDALGPEFLVNTVEVGSQSVAQKPNSVAMDDVGNFVVVWQSDSKIFAQRFSRAGTKVGGEIRVSAQGTALSEPVVAMNNEGAFTVAWTAASDDSSGQNGTGTGVYARSYTSAGVPYQTWYRVNESEGGNQSSPSVAMDDAGTVFFAFQSSGGSGDSGTDVYVRSFQVSTPIPTVVMSQRRVNTSVMTGDQTNPSIAADSGGNFVVAWQGTDASGTGIRTKIYRATGTAITGEVVANIYTAGNQSQPVLALSPSADLSSTLTARYSVAWSGPGTGDTTDGGIYFRRMGIGADPSEIRANLFTAGFQIQPTIAADYLGGVAVAWTSQFQDGSNFGVFARYFQNLPSGQLQGDPADRLVSSFTTGVQYLPSIAMDDDGDFVIAYAGEGLLDPSPLGIYARRFSSFIDDDAPQVVGVQVATAPSISQGPATGWNIARGERVISSFNQIRLQYSEQMDNSYTLSVYRDGIPLLGVLEAVTQSTTFNSTTQLWERRYQLDEPLPVGDYELRIGSEYDQAGNLLDGDNDGLPGGSFVWAFSVYPPVPQNIIPRVNQTVTGSQNYSAVAVSATGAGVVIWESTQHPGELTLYGRRFDDKGNAIGGEFLIDTITTGYQGQADVAMDAAGNFVVSWRRSNSDPLYPTGIFVRLFNANGVPKGLPIEAIDDGGMTRVAMDGAGNFVVVARELVDTPTNAFLLARRYDAAGNALGSVFEVAHPTDGSVNELSVDMDFDGDFVVGWNVHNGTVASAYARSYRADGTARTNAFLVANIDPFSPHSFDLVMDGEGNTLFAWTRTGGWGIDAQLYDALMVPRGSAFSLSTIRNSFRLAMDSDGDFALVFNDILDINGELISGAVQFFDPLGIPTSAVYPLSQVSDAAWWSPVMTDDGNLFVSWSIIQPGVSYDVFLSRFVDNTPPVAVPGGPYMVQEGQSLILSAAGSTDPDTEDQLTYAWDLNQDGVFGDAVGISPTLSWSQLVALGLGDGPIARTIYVQVSDGQSVTESDGVSLTVLNVAPSLTISAPSSAVRGEPITVMLQATDPSAADAAAGFVYKIDWNGDGSVDETVAGPANLAVTHVFTSAGNNNVRITATDKNGGVSNTAQSFVAVAAWQTRVDPNDPSKTNLHWGGTSGIDAYGFTPGFVFTQVQNNQYFAIVQPTFVGLINGKIFVYAQEGGDLIFADVIATPMMIDGGGGRMTPSSAVTVTTSCSAERSEPMAMICFTAALAMTSSWVTTVPTRSMVAVAATCSSRVH
jgi:hypothetical protein